MIKLIAISALLATVTGCGGERYQDLQAFMRETEKSSPRRIESLPEMKAYVTFEYAGVCASAAADSHIT